MGYPVRFKVFVTVISALLSLAFSGTALAVDPIAAKQLARKESCLRCHAVNKKKEGPSYESVAYKYKDQKEAVDKLVEHITSGERVKLSDGHMEDHKIVKTNDPEKIRNLIAWILTR